ncbi:MAG: ion channel [Polyangiaceae bacterium]
MSNGVGLEPKKIRFPSEARASSVSVHALGQHVSYFEDLYHKVLTIPWWRFFAYVTAMWVGTNLAFAALYAARPGCVSNASPGLEDAFYFSVQTFATIGYGGMAPATRYGHLVVVFEALVGTLGIALVTGVTFAKFARPTARVLFAEKAVIHVRDGVPHIVFRLANWRGNMVVEGQLRVILLVLQRTQEGDVIRLPVELPLVRDRTALFALSWMPMHRIDENSPFWGGRSAIARLAEAGAELFLAFTGIDETIGQQIHARYRYKLDDIVLNARFADVLTIERTGDRTINYARFHEVEALGQDDGLRWTRAGAGAAAKPDRVPAEAAIASGTREEVS